MQFHILTIFHLCLRLSYSLVYKFEVLFSLLTDHMHFTTLHGLCWKLQLHCHRVCSSFWLCVWCSQSHLQFLVDLQGQLLSYKFNCIRVERTFFEIYPFSYLLPHFWCLQVFCWTHLPVSFCLLPGLQPDSSHPQFLIFFLSLLPFSSISSTC